jgi:allantoin racemase
MKILVVNPNTTASMTDKIRETAIAIAAPGTEIVACNPADGPVSIEGHYDEAYCVPGLLCEAKKGAAEGADALVIACFDDPGLEACREVLDIPVIGICEAAMAAASMVGHGFSVVTTLPRAVPIIEALAFKYGFERQCRKVRSAEIPVLALEEKGGGAAAKVREEVLAAIEHDHAEAVLLGCAGMTDLADALTKETGVPVIDGVAAAVKFAEAMVGLGIKTCKRRAYEAPRAKKYTGAFAFAAPEAKA